MAALTSSERALELIDCYGGIEGEHHKTWVLDQVVRLLAGEFYQEWRDNRKTDGYGWEEGIAP